MAALAVRIDKHLAARQHIRVGLGYWRDRRANGLDVGLDCIPTGNPANLELVAATAGQRVEVGDIRLLGNTVVFDNQSLSAGDRPDIELEVLFFVALGRPIERPLGLPARVGVIEVCVLRNRPLGTRWENPYDVIGKAERVAGGARTPTIVGHAARDGRLACRWRV